MVLYLDVRPGYAADLAMGLLHRVSNGANHAGPFFGASIDVVILAIVHSIINHIREASLDLGDDSVEVIVDRDSHRVDLLLVLEELLSQHHDYPSYRKCDILLSMLCSMYYSQSFSLRWLSFSSELSSSP